MAENNAGPAKPSGRKLESLATPVKNVKKRPPQLPLYFPPDAEVLRTPFRAKVLQSIYEIARQELGDSLESAIVLANKDYEDPSCIMLVLAIWADVDKHGWSRADKAIHNAVFDQEASWTEDELDDYLNTIHYEILPLRV
jgi:hypothetical protein